MFLTLKETFPFQKQQEETEKRFCNYTAKGFGAEQSLQPALPPQTTQNSTNYEEAFACKAQVRLLVEKSFLRNLLV